MRCYYTVFPGSSVVKNPPTMQAAQEKRAPSLGWEDPLAQEMTNTIVFLPGEFRGQRSLVGSMGLQKVGHD